MAKIGDHEVHPICEATPEMRGQEFRDLVRDIKHNGLYEPIWLYDGKIIDGRHRYRACLEAGVDPEFRHWEGEATSQELAVFVMSQNRFRRHLTSSQKSALGARLEHYFRPKARERKRESDRKNAIKMNEKRRLEKSTSQGDDVDGDGGSESAKEDEDAQPKSFGRAQDAQPKSFGRAQEDKETQPESDQEKEPNDSEQQKPQETEIPTEGDGDEEEEQDGPFLVADKIAEIVGTNERYQEKAIRLRDERPDLFQEILEGTQSVNAAYQKYQQDLEQEEVEEVVAELKPYYELHDTDADGLLNSLEHDSVDLVMTELPMNDVDQTLLRKWISAIARATRLSGRVYLFIDPEPLLLHRLLDTLFGELNPAWTIGSILTPQVKVIDMPHKMDYRTTTDKFSWKACIHIYGSDAIALSGRCKSRRDQEAHRSEDISEFAERIVQHATEPGDLIVDPFTQDTLFLDAAYNWGRSAEGVKGG